ncbi:MAG TPA: hypothetical protein PLV68_08135, partial [Ilumatobacteraceae bacterium]|nr:hypothetical protein [Ilumatobacteraceae bacterium]
APTMSVINYRPGQTRSNTVAANVSASGRIGLRSTGSSDLVVDIMGYFAPTTSASAGRVVAVTPRRLLDTR